MKEILEATPDERRQYFEEAAFRSTHIKKALIIEKDFWVCWTLERIFSNSMLSPHITFKGGTSLSKCYNIINRFSEDIDLTISKKYIGITEDSDPANISGTNQRNKRLNELTEKVKYKINLEIKPILLNEIKEHLSPYFKDEEWRLVTDEKDEQTLIFHYPSFYNKDDYIQSVIKLEFGARGDINPCEAKTITPYIQQFLPALFSAPIQIKVSALVARRTFWEKVTLLHGEYHRDNKPLPARMFRHYYDINMLDKNNLTQEALQDTALLHDVVKNKTIYFPSKWTNYQEAKIGSLRLYPNEKYIAQLERDHKMMREMFFGEQPDFNETMAAIKIIEEKINQ